MCHIHALKPKTATSSIAVKLAVLVRCSNVMLMTIHAMTVQLMLTECVPSEAGTHHHW